MSASNAAPPSPPETDSKTSTRRRHVVVVSTEQNSLAELASPPVDERIQTNRRDLAHSLRGDTVVGVLRDPRIGVIAPHRVSPRQKRTVAKVHKPRWLTVVSVLTKNAILLLVLVWLGQAMWRWNYGYVPSSDAPFAALDLENRVSEVEALLRKTTKMTQVQLDVMETRTKRNEEMVSDIEKNVRGLEGTARDLEKLFAELGSAGFLTRKEFESFANELKESTGAGDGGKGVALDDISRYAREVVVKEIERHAADGIGRVDYASGPGGARVLKHSETYASWKAGSWLPVKRGRSDVHAHAQKMLEPSFGEPGRCFALKGSSGFVDIKLVAGIVLDAVTLEHVAKSVAYDRSSAPKDCRVWGWFEGPEDDPISEYEKMSLLKEFTYTLNASNVQTFDLETAPPSIVNMVRLEFKSNHGSSSHTCIYRFRVHGEKPSLLDRDGTVV